MSVRLGLIGIGRWGKRYIQTLSNFEGARLTHLCTRYPKNAELVPYPVETTNDWKNLCQPGKLDGVIIATPPATHAEILDACLAAKLPVLVEKPLCSRLQEALQIQQRVRSSGVPVLVDHTLLFHPAYQELKSRAKPAQIRLIHSEGQAYGPFRGGAVSALWDWAPHDFALCLDLVGQMPKSIQCLGAAVQSKEAANAEMLAIQLEFPGAVAWIHIGRLSVQKRRRLSVFSEGGILVMDDTADQKLMEHVGPWGEEVEDRNHSLRMKAVPVSSELPLAGAVKEFVSGISGKISSRFGVDLAVDVMRLLEAAQQSLEDSSRVVHF